MKGTNRISAARTPHTMGFEIPPEETLAQRAKVSVDRLRKEGRADKPVP